MPRATVRAACLAAALAAAASQAAAQEAAQQAVCTASIEGEDVEITHDSALTPAPSRLDWLFGGSEDDSCAPEVVLAHLTPLLTEEERMPFCLMVDAEAETVTGFSQGERKGDLTCRTPSAFCERVNGTRDAALGLAGIDLEDGLVENAAGVSGRISAVRDAAGNTIVQGAAGLVSGTLGSLGATTLSALTAPAAVAAATVTVVAAGGAVYVCR